MDPESGELRRQTFNPEDVTEGRPRVLKFRHGVNYLVMNLLFMLVKHKCSCGKSLKSFGKVAILASNGPREDLSKFSAKVVKIVSRENS